MKGTKTLQSVGTEPISYGQRLNIVHESAASAMRALLQYVDAYTVAQHKLVLGTKVYLATVDVCLKALAGSARPTSKPMFREREEPSRRHHRRVSEAPGVHSKRDSLCVASGDLCGRLVPKASGSALGNLGAPPVEACLADALHAAGCPGVQTPSCTRVCPGWGAAQPEAALRC